MPDQITRFDRPTLRALRPHLENLLTPLAAQGLRVRVGSMKFTDSTVDVKLELVVDRPGSVPESKEAAAFRQFAPVYGFRADQLGVPFRYEGETFRITGLRTRAPRRPICIASDSGKRYVCPPEMVLGLLARAAS